MEGNNLKSLIDILKQEKNSDEERIHKTIQNALIAAYKKKYGKNLENGQAVFDDEKGIYHLYARKEVVDDDDLYSPLTEIELSDAKNIDENAKVDGDYTVDVEIDINEFTRSDIQLFKSKVIGSFKEDMNTMILNEYQDRKGIISGIFLKRSANRDIIVELKKGVEAILPRNMQSSRDEFEPGDRIKAVINSVSIEKRTKDSRVSIVLSRSSATFVEELLRNLVPEINEGIIKIYKSVREVGLRTKISVYSERQDIDPISLCLGNRAINIQEIKKELGGEIVDIVKFSKNINEFIQNAINSAKIEYIQILDEQKRLALAIVVESDLVFAIGKRGSNINLVNRLLDWNISLKTKSQIQNDDNIPEDIKQQIDSIFSKNEEIISLSQIAEIPQDLLEILVKNEKDDFKKLIHMSDREILEMEGMSRDYLNILKDILSEYEESEEVINEVQNHEENEIISTLEKTKETETVQDDEDIQPEIVNNDTKEILEEEIQDDEDEEVEFVSDLPFSEEIIKKLNANGLKLIVDLIDTKEEDLEQKGFSEDQVNEIKSILEELKED